MIIVLTEINFDTIRLCPPPRIKLKASDVVWTQLLDNLVIIDKGISLQQESNSQ